MTSRLKQAIEKVCNDWDGGGTDDLSDMISELYNAYHEESKNGTDTQNRISYLQECLEKGMSKRDAAKALCEHDPRVGPKTAETLVYTAFSGMYQTSKRGRKGKTTRATRIPAPTFVPPSSSDDDEGLL